AHRILPPAPRSVARDEIDADARLGPLGSVVPPRGQNGGGRLAPDAASGLLAVGRDAGQILRQRRIERVRLRRVQACQRVVRRLRDGRIHRGARRRRILFGEALPLAGEGVDGVENRDVDDRHRPAGPPGPELFPEYASLAGCDRSVIDPGGVNRDPIPVNYPAACVEWYRTKPALRLSFQLRVGVNLGRPTGRNVPGSIRRSRGKFRSPKGFEPSSGALRKSKRTEACQQRGERQYCGVAGHTTSHPGPPFGVEPTRKQRTTQSAGDNIDLLELAYVSTCGSKRPARARLTPLADELEEISRTPKVRGNRR